MAKNKRRSGSKYQGGFKTVNGRLNNTSAYNHDYYLRNKYRWKPYSDKHEKPKKKYNAVQDWFGLDERDAYRKSWDVYYDTQDYNDRLRSFDPHNGFYHPVKGMDWEGFDKERDRREGLIDLAEKNIDQQYSRYMKTPLGKISKLADDVSWELEKAGEKISKPFKAIGKALSDAYDEVDFQLWRLGKKIKGEW